MTLQQRIGRSVVRRNRKLLKRLPSLEIIEPRVLLAAGPGFVQGFDLNSSNVGIPNATVTLTNTSNNQSISTMTNGVGYYAFNGVAPGTYDVTQTAANYVQSGVNIQTTVNPASALPDNGGIQVTVLNLGVPQPITATWATNPYSPGSYQNTNISINAPGFQTPALETYNKQLTGQLGVTLSGNQGNVTSILSLCTDLIEGIDIPPPASSFTAEPGLAPAPARPRPPRSRPTSAKSVIFIIPTDSLSRVPPLPLRQSTGLRFNSHCGLFCTMTWRTRRVLTETQVSRTDKTSRCSHQRIQRL